MKALILDPFEIGYYNAEYGPYELESYEDMKESVVLDGFQENDLIKVDGRYYLVLSDSYIEDGQMIIDAREIKLKARFYSDRDSSVPIFTMKNQD